jgi:hypothetical protein
MNPPDHPTPRTDAAIKEHTSSDIFFDYVLPQDMAILERELTRVRALFPAILSALRNGGGCTTDVSVEFLECVPNEVASVVSRLRAEVERWKTVAAEMSQQREHNANEAARQLAEVERLKEQLRIESAASAHALHWAEKAEIELAAMKGKP